MVVAAYCVRCVGALEQHSESDLPEKLKLHAVYYFDGLQKAKAALKTDRRVSAGWSKAKVIANAHSEAQVGQAARLCSSAA
jgi:hypothetical protein